MTFCLGLLTEAERRVLPLHPKGQWRMAAPAGGYPRYGQQVPPALTAGSPSHSG